MSRLGTRDQRHERNYVINYVRGTRVLGDSARSLDAAKARIQARLSKRHNKGEVGRVFLNGKLVLEVAP